MNMIIIAGRGASVAPRTCGTLDTEAHTLESSGKPMNIHIMQNSSTPIYRQIANQIKEGILIGEIREGLFLPSERSLATVSGVHRNTVTRSYHELIEEGYIRSIPGRGYQVALGDETLQTVPVGGQRKEESFSALAGTIPGIPWDALVREELIDYKSTFDDLFSISYAHRGISFASGIVPREAWFEEDFRRILREAAAGEAADILDYTPYQGQIGLRRNLCAMLQAWGIKASAEEIVVVNESNQALNYIGELLIKRGDKVAVEEPGSPDVYRTLTLLGAELMGVPVDRDGMRMDALERLIRHEKPKFICVSSSFQDPTGAAISLEGRRRLLALSQRHMIPVLEDYSGSEICFTKRGAPPLKSMDISGNVIFIKSFALTMAPGLKMAFIAAHRQLAKKIRYLQSIHMINLDSINQSMISRYIESGCYINNAAKIKEIYERKRDLMCEGLGQARQFGLTWQKPEGGVYLWCRLPTKADPRKFVKEAARRGVYIMPGALFYPKGNCGDGYIRLNYSFPSEEEIVRGTEILTQTLRACTENHGEARKEN